MPNRAARSDEGRRNPDDCLKAAKPRDEAAILQHQSEQRLNGFGNCSSLPARLLTGQKWLLDDWRIGMGMGRLVGSRNPRNRESVPLRSFARPQHSTPRVSSLSHPANTSRQLVSPANRSPMASLAAACRVSARAASQQLRNASARRGERLRRSDVELSLTALV